MMANGADRGPSVVAAMLLVGSLTAPPAGELPLARVRFDSVRELLVIESPATPAVRLPALLVGMPLERNARVLVTAMISNATPIARHGVRVRVTYGSRRAGLFPLFRAYPWVMDAPPRLRRRTRTD